MDIGNFIKRNLKLNNMKTLIILTTLIIILFSSCTQEMEDDIRITSKRKSNVKEGFYLYETTHNIIDYRTQRNLEIGDNIIKNCDINPRSYQIEIEEDIDHKDWLFIYDERRLVGKIFINNTKLDSLIIKDNQ